MKTFHIPDDWSVLVLEDTDERISWFRERIPQAVYVKTTDAAIRELSRHTFQAVFLDHDLEWMRRC
jgi:hypothetical protein